MVLFSAKFNGSGGREVVPESPFIVILVNSVVISSPPLFSKLNTNVSKEVNKVSFELQEKIRSTDPEGKGFCKSIHNRTVLLF